MPDDAKETAEKLMGLFPPIVHIHCKYQNCTLHFKIYTWYPDKWKERDPICPECGVTAYKLRFEPSEEPFIDFS
ncbi:MAG: hypothetical protein RTU30_05155 [Candidatus Thorarchaeota archaeon]